MEDAYAVAITPDYAFFGLYDGHGGKDVSSFVARTLHTHLGALNNTRNIATEATTVENVIQDAFKSTQKNIPHTIAECQGSTAVVALIHNNSLFIAHIGDSRAILASGNTVTLASSDHKPDRPDEIERIEKIGGKVVGGFPFGVARVANKRVGGLAVSRAFGDKSYEPYVIQTPEIVTKKLDRTDSFLILACDGVWDVINNQEAVNIINNSLTTAPGNYKQAARILRNTAFGKGSTDNISVMVINLEPFLTRNGQKKFCKIGLPH